MGFGAKAGLCALALLVGCAGPAVVSQQAVVVDLPRAQVAPLPSSDTQADAEDDADPELRSLADCTARLRQADEAPAGPIRQRYLFALDADDRGDLMIAREAYQWVVKHADADSPYVPLSFVGMAVMYESGGQLGIARRLLGKAVAWPTANNPIYLYARYRRGLADQQLAEHDKAMFELMQVIKHARSHPDQRCGELVGQASLKALIHSYVAAGVPDRAHHFFARISGDVGGGHMHTIDVLLQLARAYLAANQAKDAVTMLNAMLGRYDLLRPQCADVALLVTSIRAKKLSGVSLEALAARLEERCGGMPR